jgi:hypothetical protein
VPEDPDSELVSRVRAGDEGAFAELAGKYQGAMLSIARGYVRCAAFLNRRNRSVAPV